MSPLVALLACAFYLLLVPYSAEASKRKLPECHKVLGSAISPRVRGEMYDEILAAMKRDFMEYSCVLEKVAGKIAREGSRSMPERKALYFQGAKDTLDVKTIVSNWKNHLQRMGNVQKFGCTVLVGEKLYKTACVFE